jgi:hypothetical protein
MLNTRFLASHAYSALVISAVSVELKKRQGKTRQDNKRLAKRLPFITPYFPSHKYDFFCPWFRCWILGMCNLESVLSGGIGSIRVGQEVYT